MLNLFPGKPSRVLLQLLRLLEIRVVWRKKRLTAGRQRSFETKLDNLISMIRGYYLQKKHFGAVSGMPAEMISLHGQELGVNEIWSIRSEIVTDLVKVYSGHISKFEIQSLKYIDAEAMEEEVRSLDTAGMHLVGLMFSCFVGVSSTKAAFLNNNRFIDPPCYNEVDPSCPRPDANLY